MCGDMMCKRHKYYRRAKVSPEILLNEIYDINNNYVCNLYNVLREEKREREKRKCITTINRCNVIHVGGAGGEKGAARRKRVCKYTYFFEAYSSPTYRLTTVSLFICARIVVPEMSVAKFHPQSIMR